MKRLIFNATALQALRKLPLQLDLTLLEPLSMWVRWVAGLWNFGTKLYYKSTFDAVNLFVKMVESQTNNQSKR